MSAIRRPWASFRGVFTTNVPTANNDKVSIVLDEPNIEVVNPPEVVPPNTGNTANPPKIPDEDYRLLMMKTVTVTNPGPPTTWLNSYFNYFGDSGMSFTAAQDAGMPYQNTVIMASVLPDGKTYKQGGDPLIGGRVELWGDLFFDRPGAAKMVDLDPIGIYGTQIFSGEVRIVDPATGTIMLSGKNSTRAYIRAMYMDRNITSPGPTLPPGPWLGGAIWQVGLPLETLTFNPKYLNQSPTLMALQNAAQAGQGLLMRFATYYTIDGIDEDKLAEKFAASGYKEPIINPATGMLVGSIGPWETGELASVPVGRLLYPTPSSPITRPPSDYVLNIAMRDRSPLIKADSGTSAPPHYLAPIPVVIDAERQMVILDFLTTIPEASSLNDQQPLSKANFGNLTLTILSNGSEQTVATIPYEQYNRAAYELGSGIIEIPYSSTLAPALADPNGIFRLYGQTLGTQPVMYEIDYGYVLTDDQCLYLHEGESVTYQIQVFYKGRPVRNRNVAITTSQYQFVYAPPAAGSLPVRTFQPLDNSTGKEFVVSIPPQQTGSRARTSKSRPANPRVYYTTDANGIITLQVKGLQRGAAVVRYQLDGDDFDPNMGSNTPPLKYSYFGFTFYNNFRVLPNDNYDNIPDDQITWDFVYQEVIQYFYLLYPGMFAILAFQNEEIARQNASLIRQMVSKRTWDSTSYMPVSRDLSDGKRKLLQRWCALQQ